MKQYTIKQLENPQTYLNDPELNDFARSLAGSIRQIIREEHGHGVDEAALVLSGAYASRVHKSWEKRRAKMVAQQEQNNTDLANAQQIIAQLSPPDGVAVTIQVNHIRLWSQNLHRRR